MIFISNLRRSSHPAVQKNLSKALTPKAKNKLTLVQPLRREEALLAPYHSIQAIKLIAA